MAIECEAEITQFVTDIWSTFLNMKAVPSDKSFAPKGKGNTLAGCVQITGRWKGTVTLYAPREIGQKVASIMYGLDEGEVENQQTQDVIGEITNIIAGNVKSLLPAPCSISLPSVAVTDYSLYHPGSEMVSAVNFECEGLPFRVVVLQEYEK